MHPAAPRRGGGGRGEAELLADLRCGNREAAETLVELTYPLIYKSLYRLCGDADAAADLTQETYSRAWRELAQFDGRSRFSTWLYRIAYTTFLNHVRRPQRFVPFDDVAVESVERGQPLGDDPLLRLDSLRLRREVLALPEELRFAITAHFWGEVPLREIARQEGLTTMAIRKRLRRAIARLRTRMREEPS
ncbi:MAG TPA: sigma-70 family RNA polymerase sigma factor [Thermoanaerobaculia bacterium]|nr:sigma-70 family RNA polymerase sigma factor [Thermoanaerobaculia bacterium]